MCKYFISRLYLVALSVLIQKEYLFALLFGFKLEHDLMDTDYWVQMVALMIVLSQHIETQTYDSFRKMLIQFVNACQNMWIFGVCLFSSDRTTVSQQLNGGKWKCTYLVLVVVCSVPRVFLQLSHVDFLQNRSRDWVKNCCDFFSILFHSCWWGPVKLLCLDFPLSKFWGLLQMDTAYCVTGHRLLCHFLTGSHKLYSRTVILP